MSQTITKIGVFYDGGFFQHVSNYYYYNHPRRTRIRITGLHDFIRHLTAEFEDRDTRLCQIVDAHLFKGRMYAPEITPNQLYYERVFDDILMSEGIVTHYLPYRMTSIGKKQEKGIDVWFALEAYELCVQKQFDVVVLIASDGDYAPLVRKINALGSRVMVLSWEFSYTSEQGYEVNTRTSYELLKESSYPIFMEKVIDQPKPHHEALVSNMFVQSAFKRKARLENQDDSEEFDDDGSEFDDDFNEDDMTGMSQSLRRFANSDSLFHDEDSFEDSKGNLLSHSNENLPRSTVLNLKNGYGFIKHPPNNLFFHYTQLTDTDFNMLRIGDVVEFVIAQNDRGEDIATEVRLIESAPAYY